jgi:hypothetical protein
MVLFTKGILSMILLDTVQVFKFGLIMPNMKVNGVKTKQMAEANSGMLMVTFTKVNGKMIRPMVMVSTFTSTELSMKDTGRTIFRMAKVWKVGKMVVAMRVATKKA